MRLTAPELALRRLQATGSPTIADLSASVSDQPVRRNPKEGQVSVSDAERFADRRLEVAHGLADLLLNAGRIGLCDLGSLNRAPDCGREAVPTAFVVSSETQRAPQEGGTPGLALTGLHLNS